MYWLSRANFLFLTDHCRWDIEDPLEISHLRYRIPTWDIASWSLLSSKFHLYGATWGLIELCVDVRRYVRDKMGGWGLRKSWEWLKAPALWTTIICEEESQPRPTVISQNQLWDVPIVHSSICSYKKRGNWDMIDVRTYMMYTIIISKPWWGD